MDNQTAREALRETMMIYDNTYEMMYNMLGQLTLSEITAYMWGNGCKHITELADLLTRRKMNESLDL